MTEIMTIDYNDKEIVKTLKATVAAGTTNEEFLLFTEMCKATGLNPFKKEVWCIVTSPDNPKYRKLQMMTGVNGFYSIANGNPNFDGIEIEEGQEIETSIDGKVIKHPEWVKARVYRKDRKIPTEFKAKWSEYHQPLVSKYGKLSIWAKMPTVMLSKCAESMALRKAFPQEMNGLYTQEEMPNNFAIKEDAKPATKEQEDLLSTLKTADQVDVSKKALHTYEVSALMDTDKEEGLKEYLEMRGLSLDLDTDKDGRAIALVNSVEPLNRLEKYLVN